MKARPGIRVLRWLIGQHHENKKASSTEAKHLTASVVKIIMRDIRGKKKNEGKCGVTAQFIGKMCWQKYKVRKCVPKI